MHDVPLGDVAHHVFVGIYVVVVVVGVVVDAAARCGTDAVETVEQGGFARAGASHDGDESPRLDAEGHLAHKFRLAVRSAVGDLFRHAHRVDLYAGGRGGEEQSALEEGVGGGGDGDAVVVAEFGAAYLAVVDERAPRAVQVLDVVVLAVIDDAEVLLVDHGVVHHDVAGGVAPDDGEGALGEVEVAASALAGDLLHLRDLDAVAVFFSRLSDDDVAVEAYDGLAETLAAHQHFGLIPLGSEIFDVPYVVFLQKTQLDGRHDEGFDRDVAGALRSHDELLLRLAVEEVEKLAVADFEDQIAHGSPCAEKAEEGFPTARPRCRTLIQYKLFSPENQADYALPTRASTRIFSVPLAGGQTSKNRSLSPFF